MELQHTVDEIAALVGGRVHGSGDRRISGLRSLEQAQAADMAAVFRPEYMDRAAGSAAGVLLLPPGVSIEASETRSLIEVEDPELAVDLVAERLGPSTGDPPSGVHPTAVVEEGASVDPSASVGPGAFVGRGAVIGARSRVWARAFIGEDAVIGDDCRLYPGVFIGARCELGQRVTIHPNAVIGADGFGYRPDEQGRFVKSPQVGHVVLADDVEIGACTTIDRARLETTRVERGAKLDNLVHIAHSCVIGEDTAVAAQSGLAGRASLGRHVQVAGHCAINTGTHVADGTILGGMTGIMKDTRPGEFLVGFPAYPKREWTRLHLSLRKVPGLLASLREERGGGDKRDS